MRSVRKLHHAITTGAVLSTLMAAALLPQAANGATPGVAEARVEQGALVGSSQDDIDRFLGIPYAEPPIGALRWQPPVAARRWGGVRRASSFGQACPQRDDLKGISIGDEDCLTLNVFAPKRSNPGVRRPVLVWVHGGGFSTGASSRYDAAVLAQKLDAVVVTVNYRLGVFGFLATSGMKAEGESLNFGLQDQYEALRWVRRNAAAFGGDSERVTLVGESAGGSAAGCLALTSPESAGLFQRAISMSSYCANVADALPIAVSAGDALATKAGCQTTADQMACLRAKPAADLLAAGSPPYVSATLPTGDWHAVIDGAVLPLPIMAALAKGRFHQVPVMIGTTRDEGRLFVGVQHQIQQRPVNEADYIGVVQAVAGQDGAANVAMAYSLGRYGSLDLAVSALMTDAIFACPTQAVARYLSERVPTYVYEFADRNAPISARNPFMPMGAYHASELAYFFRTPASDAAFSADQKALSDTMISYWRRFLRTGNPSAGPFDPLVPAPTWPRFARRFEPLQHLAPQQVNARFVWEFQQEHQCLLWSTLSRAQ